MILCSVHAAVKKLMMSNTDSNCCKPPRSGEKRIPAPPPLPRFTAIGCPCDCLVTNNYSAQKGSATRDLWERLFDAGYRADVCINTENGGIVYAHSNILVSSFT